MRRFVGLVLMGGVLAVAAPSALAQKKPEHVTAGPKEFKLLGDFMAQAKEIPAELRSVDEKKGKVVVRIENTVATDPDGFKNANEDLRQKGEHLQNLQKQLLQHQYQARTRTKGGAQNNQQSMQNLQQQMKKAHDEFTAAQHKANPHNYQRTTFIDYHLALKENAPVRKMTVAATISPEQRTKLKGKDKSLPGYTAAYADLKQGMSIKLQLEVPKDKAEVKTTTGNSSTAAEGAEAKTADPATAEAKAPDAKVPATRTPDAKPPADEVTTPETPSTTEAPVVESQPRPVVKMIIIPAPVTKKKVPAY